MKRRLGCPSAHCPKAEYRKQAARRRYHLGRCPRLGVHPPPAKSGTTAKIFSVDAQELQAPARWGKIVRNRTEERHGRNA